MFVSRVLMREGSGTKKATFNIDTFLLRVPLDADEMGVFVEMLSSVVRATALYTMIKTEAIRIDEIAGLREIE